MAADEDVTERVVFSAGWAEVFPHPSVNRATTLAGGVEKSPLWNTTTHLM